jgi:hypothetical protein
MFEQYRLSYTGLGEKMVNRLFIAAVAAGIVATSGFASADSVSAYLASVAPITPTAMNLDFGGTTFNSGYVGAINWTNVNISGATAADKTIVQGSATFIANDTLTTYCIEGTQDVYINATATWTGSVNDGGLAVTTLNMAPNPETHFTATQVKQINAFYNAFYGASLSGYSADATYGTVAAANTSAAFQLGIWEIASGDDVAGETYNASLFANGNFQANGNTAAMNQAESWLGTIGLASNYSGPSNVFVLTDDTLQDQIFSSSLAGAPPTTPLPAALPAGMSAMLCLGAAQFLRRRRQTVAA